MICTPYTPHLFDSPEESEHFSRLIISLLEVCSPRLELYHKGGRFLHLFCEDGHFLKYFGEKSPQWELYGVDGCPEAVEEARRNCSAQITQKVCPPLPYPDNFFNLVFHKIIFDYSGYRHINIPSIPVTFKFEEMVSEIYRVTNRGGLYCVFDFLNSEEARMITSTGFDRLDERFFLKR